MDNTHSVKLSNLAEEMGIEVYYKPDNYDSVEVKTTDVNRPGLQLTGFYDYFVSDRIQIIGIVETTYLKELSSEERMQKFEKLFCHGIPALVICHDIEPYTECIEAAKKYSITIILTKQETSDFMAAVIAQLKVRLAPRITRHGVLVEVYGEGLLLLGESGVGKSETAIELVKRGHRLIADDAVEIKKVSDTTLVGSASELIKHYIELRGIGVINVRRLFGIGAVKPTERIDLVINLENWKERFMYDRLGLDNQYTNILDVQVPSLIVPVKPGRNLAVIIEVAAMNHRQKKMGYNSALELTEQINQYFEANTPPTED